MRREAVRLGKRFRAIRGDRSLRQFAALLKCSPSTLSTYERGLIPDAVLLIARLGQRADVDLNEFLGNGGK